MSEFQSNIIWRTADLLGVSSRQRIELRQRVAVEGPAESSLILSESISSLEMSASKSCYAYWIKLVRRRLNSSSVIDPDFFSWSSLVISSAAL